MPGAGGGEVGRGLSMGAMTSWGSGLLMGVASSEKGVGSGRLTGVASSGGVAGWLVWHLLRERGEWTLDNMASSGGVASWLAWHLLRGEW